MTFNVNLWSNNGKIISFFDRRNHHRHCTLTGHSPPLDYWCRRCFVSLGLCGPCVSLCEKETQQKSKRHGVMGYVFSSPAIQTSVRCTTIHILQCKHTLVKYSCMAKRIWHVLSLFCNRFFCGTQLTKLELKKIMKGIRNNGQVL